MISAFGVEHGSLVSKSYVKGKFVAATKAGAKALRAERHAYVKGGKGGAGGGRYKKSVPDDTNERLKMALDIRRIKMSQLTGVDMTVRPAEKLREVGTKSGKYKNAHPEIWGSKKDGRITLVGDKMDDQTKAHELMHAKKRSSWRLVQIEDDPVKLAREEARVDTLSGTHSLKHGIGIRSHTDANRKLASNASKYRAKGAKAGADAKKRGNGTFRGMVSEARESTYNAAADKGEAFARVQDKLDSKGGFGAKAAYEAREKRRRNQKVLAGVGAASGGGIAVAAYQTKDGRKVKGYERKK